MPTQSALRWSSSTSACSPIPSCSPIFAGIDMPHLRAHQRQFLLHILGGPDRYSDPGHQGRAQRSRHHRRLFDLTIGHLIASLGDVGVAPDVVDRAGTDIEALRALIVTAL